MRHSFSVFPIRSGIVTASLVAGALLGFCRTSVAAPTYSFYNFDVPGSGFTHAQGISSGGDVVGYYGAGSPYVLGFVLDPASGSYTILNDPAGLSGTAATGINSLGQVVGYIYPYSPGTFTGPGGPSYRGFLFDPSSGSYITLTPALSDYYSFPTASGINDAGQIVGSYASTNLNVRGFLRDTSGNYTGFADPDATTNPRSSTFTFANGINNAGQIVGSISSNNDQVARSGYVFDPASGGYTTLNDPAANPAFETYAQGINNAGLIVGYYVNNSVSYAYVFDPASGSYINLSDPSATTGTEAFGINDAGQIVGTYFDSTGAHGFIATPEIEPLPEPTSLTLLGSGLAIGIVARRRRCSI